MKLNRASSLFLIFVLIFIFVVGVYRINDTLFFYADQAGDAIRIWRIWYEHQFVLAGTETSIGPEVRVGPLFLYLLAPFYALGRGNPVPASVFLVLIWVLGIFLTYRFAKKAFDQKTAWLVIILFGASYYMAIFSRWLSNPTPSILLSAFLLFAMHKIMNNKGITWWVLSAFFVGLFFHFQAASGFFYTFVLLIFTFWQRKKGLNVKIIVLMGLSFFLTFLPLLFHNFRNDNILFRGLAKYIIDDGSFDLTGRTQGGSRAEFIVSVFRRLFFPSRPKIALFWLFSLAAVAFLNSKKLLANRYFKLLLMILVVPLVGTLFFNDSLQSYYFSGFFAPVFLVIAYILSTLTKSNLGKIFLTAFLVSFLVVNLRQTAFFLKQDVDDPQKVSFKNQKEAVAWIANESEKEEIDVKIFVPDKQTDGLDYGFPYAYLLLLKDRLTVNNLEQCRPDTQKESRFYFETFYVLREYDPFIERFDAWRSCHKIEETVILKTASFGGITVEKRMIDEKI